MYYTEMSVWGIIIWIIFGLVAIFPWITILAVAIYKFIQVIRLPRLKNPQPHF
jgi:hypothetical protein